MYVGYVRLYVFMYARVYVCLHVRSPSLQRRGFNSSSFPESIIASSSAVISYFTSVTCLSRHSESKFILLAQIFFHIKWVPVTTAWHVLRLRMEERPLDMEGSCEYIE
jgi:hypothetical protein